MKQQPKRPLFLALFCLVLLAAGCGPAAVSQPEAPEPTPAPWSAAAEQLAGADSRYPLEEDFLQWCEQQSPGLSDALAQRAASGEAYTDDWFWEESGSTLEALHTLYTYRDGPLPDNVHLIEADGPVTLAFGGDVNFADDWYNMRHYHQTAGVEDCFGPELLERMRAADILLLNNEFCFSDRGSPLPGKTYTFRAAPENVEMWHELGADIVGLANNHVYDFGGDAFSDTLRILKEADIPAVGAGENLEEAMQPQYFLAGGMKIGYVASTRAEKYIMTPAAGPDAPGVLRTYEPELALEAIRQAKEQCDYLVMYVHWGTEGSTVLEQAQTDLAGQFAQAGADLIVGAHTHILQGAGWRGDVPVLYSMGNFWFNMETEDTALAEVTLSGPHAADAQVRMLPCIQSGGRTALAEEAAAQRILGNLNRVMESGSFDESGLLQKP